MTAEPSLTPSTETNGARRTDSPRPVRVDGPERRLRVVHSLDGYGVGGTELNCVRTLEQLDRDRFELSLVTLAEDGPLRSRFEAAGIPIRTFPVPNFYGPTAVRQAARLVALFRRMRPDVVHCHDCYTNVFVAACARAAGVPLVIASRRWWDARPGRAYVVANGISYRHVAHRVLANSEAVGRRAQEAERVAPERIAVVPNFLEPDAFEGLSPQARLALLGELQVPRGAIVVGCVARLRAEKNLPMLLRAVQVLAQRIPGLHAVLVGDGPAEGELRSLAHELGITERVHFAGHRPNRPNPHSLFDISVLCSEREGFPNSVIEAMAVARPVVATRVGGVPDVVEHGRNGLLIEPGAEASLIEALEFLAADPGRRESMGDAGQARVRSRYGAESVLRRLANLYGTARLPDHQL